MARTTRPRRSRPDPLDLARCDQEPIHIPGSIQPHGMLFALTGADLTITAVSANVTIHLGHSPRVLLNTPIRDILDEASFEAIRPARDPPSDPASRLID